MAREQLTILYRSIPNGEGRIETDQGTAVEAVNQSDDRQEPSFSKPPRPIISAPFEGHREGSEGICFTAAAAKEKNGEGQWKRREL